MGLLHQLMCHSETQVHKYSTTKAKPSKASLKFKESPIKGNTFCSGVFGPVLRELAPAANGSAVFVSWSWPGTKHWSTPGGELLHYVVEWISVPATELQWQKLAKNQNNTSITGTEHTYHSGTMTAQNPSAHTDKNTHSEINQNLELCHRKKGHKMFYP